VDWLGGAFFQHVGRHYGQDLPTPGYDALSTRLGYPISTALAAPPTLVATPGTSQDAYLEPYLRYRQLYLPMAAAMA